MIKFFLTSVLAAFAISTGIWMLSQTNYPFIRTVGGATLVIGVIIFGFVVVFIKMEDELDDRKT